MSTATTTFTAAEERVAELEEQGFTVVPDALAPDLVARLSTAMDVALERHPERKTTNPKTEAEIEAVLAAWNAKR